MKPPNLTPAQAAKALSGVLTRYGIDPSLLPQKIRRSVSPAVVASPKSPELPALTTVKSSAPIPQDNAPTPGKEQSEFHYLVEVSGSALVFHFRTSAKSAAAAKRTMLDIPNLTRWSTLIGAALKKVLADELAVDLSIATAPG